MKTKIELDQKIINITTKIYNEFPELSKYIIEIPIKASKEDQINIKNLEEYYQSLEELISKYAKTHISMKRFDDDLDVPGSELDNHQKNV